MERQWTAAVAVASKCATKAGYFELEFLREKENSFPLEFREQFAWMGPFSDGRRSAIGCGPVEWNWKELMRWLSEFF